MTEFGPAYASAYDLLYQDKDYAAECAALERTFATHATGPVGSILDLGCGTGNHALPLAQTGHEVVGVDRSAEMLNHFRAKAASLPGCAATAVLGDVRSVNLGRTFDAVLMMFAVLGYQLSNADALAALRAVRRHLHPGGLFVADFWYGPAVLTERPASRVKVTPTPSGQLLRLASAELDVRHHACAVQYRMWQVGAGPVVETAETHRMRYFFPLEIELLLDATGFELLRLGCFPDLERDPDEKTWTAAVVARATDGAGMPGGSL